MTKVIVIKTIGIDDLRYPDNLYHDIFLLINFPKNPYIRHFTCDDEDEYKSLMKNLEYTWMKPSQIKTSSNKVIYNMLRLLVSSSWRKDDIIKFQLAFNLIK